MFACMYTYIQREREREREREIERYKSLDKTHNPPTCSVRQGSRRASVFLGGLAGGCSKFRVCLD